MAFSICLYQKPSQRKLFDSAPARSRWDLSRRPPQQRVKRRHTSVSQVAQATRCDERKDESKCWSFLSQLPSDKLIAIIRISPFLIGNTSTQSGSIFHCYVSLPECILVYLNGVYKCIQWLGCLCEVRINW